jgi:hypothetical protein
VSQPPKYTLSRKQRNNEQGVAGIGWTDEGLEKFNNLYDQVKEDRMSNGISFNHVLFQVFTERQRLAKVRVGKPNERERKRKTIPRDDMRPIEVVQQRTARNLTYDTYDSFVPM